LGKHDRLKADIRKVGKINIFVKKGVSRVLDEIGKLWMGGESWNISQSILAISPIPAKNMLAWN